MPQDRGAVQQVRPAGGPTENVRVPGPQVIVGPSGARVRERPTEHDPGDVGRTDRFYREVRKTEPGIPSQPEIARETMERVELEHGVPVRELRPVIDQIEQQILFQPGPEHGREPDHETVRVRRPDLILKPQPVRAVPGSPVSPSRFVVFGHTVRVREHVHCADEHHPAGFRSSDRSCEDRQVREVTVRVRVRLPLPRRSTGHDQLIEGFDAERPDVRPVPGPVERVRPREGAADKARMTHEPAQTVHAGPIVPVPGPVNTTVPGQPRHVDRVVLGAGVFGLTAAHVYALRGMTVAVIDPEQGPMRRASKINQARLHGGYHYPRSLFTAMATARHQERFATDFAAAIDTTIEQVYAVAATGSAVTADQFEAFCRNAQIPVTSTDPRALFLPGAVEAAWRTREHTFDADRLRDLLTRRLEPFGQQVQYRFGRKLAGVARGNGTWALRLDDGTDLSCEGVVNATYAALNNVLGLFGAKPVPVKHELCEVALVRAPRHARVGVTVMDGPFFSLMPFGFTGLHSLTSVAHTPRRTSPDRHDAVFSCQTSRTDCTLRTLQDCGSCEFRPDSAVGHMRQLAGRFLIDPALEPISSMFTIKTVLRASEIDDARPTVLLRHTEDPHLVSVLSGKISTVYDLDRLP